MNTGNNDKGDDIPEDQDVENSLDFDLAGSTELVHVPPQNSGLPPTPAYSLHNMAAASKQIAKMKEPKALSLDKLQQLKIIHPDMGEKRIADIYRDLRTKLLHVSKGRNFVIAVTSLVPKSGTSHITLNIASSFSFDSTKTALIMDGNLTNPNLDKTLNVNVDIGLTDFIEDETVTLSQIIYPTGVHRLRLIPVGKRRESSTEYFTSIRMRILIDSIKRRYPDRFIFIDVPPIGDSADARILVDLCDYMLLVIPYGKVSEAKFGNIVSTLDPQKVAGVIFNMQV